MNCGASWINVCFGSEADILRNDNDVRFTQKRTCAVHRAMSA